MHSILIGFGFVSEFLITRRLVCFICSQRNRNHSSVASSEGSLSTHYVSPSSITMMITFQECISYSLVLINSPHPPQLPILPSPFHEENTKSGDHIHFGTSNTILVKTTLSTSKLKKYFQMKNIVVTLLH